MDEYQVSSIALKTLQQRCEYLQWRLNAVEEENHKLKLEKAQDLNTKNIKGLDSLEERIITLSKEKSQMAHQIEIITNENSTLWEQLSRFLPESNISSLKYSVSSSPNTQILTHYESSSKECSKESLEEISLKLINGIIIGKNELEKQCSEMVDFQNEKIAKVSLSFPHKQIDNRVTKNLKDYLQNLKDFKQTLFKQKTDLSRAIMSLKHSSVVLGQNNNNNNINNSNNNNNNNNSNNRDISNCNHIGSCTENNININELGSEFSTLQDLGRLGNADQPLDPNKNLCPMCLEHITGSFQNFSQHVYTHFDDDNDEFVDAINNFESLQ